MLKFSFKSKVLYIGAIMVVQTGNFNAVQIGPVVEPAGSHNAFQTTDPYILFRSGQVNKVPLIAGVMANEAFSFIIRKLPANKLIRCSSDLISMTAW